MTSSSSTGLNFASPFGCLKGISKLNMSNQSSWSPFNALFLPSLHHLSEWYHHSPKARLITDFFLLLICTPIYQQVLLLPIPGYLIYSKSIYFFSFSLPVLLTAYLYLAMVSLLGKTCSCFPTIYSAYLNKIEPFYCLSPAMASYFI